MGARPFLMFPSRASLSNTRDKLRGAHDPRTPHDGCPAAERTDYHAPHLHHPPLGSFIALFASALFRRTRYVAGYVVQISRANSQPWPLSFRNTRTVLPSRTEASPPAQEATLHLKEVRSSAHSAATSTSS